VDLFLRAIVDVAGTSRTEIATEVTGQAVARALRLYSLALDANASTGLDFLRASVASRELASLLALLQVLYSRLPLGTGLPYANESKRSPRLGSLN
jgi:hypothetical protein